MKRKNNTTDADLENIVFQLRAEWNLAKIILKWLFQPALGLLGIGLLFSAIYLGLKFNGKLMLQEAQPTNRQQGSNRDGVKSFYSRTVEAIPTEH